MKTRAMLRRGVHALVRELPDTSLTARTDEMRRLQIATECYAIEKLEALVLSDEFKTEDVTSPPHRIPGERRGAQEQPPDAHHVIQSGQPRRRRETLRVPNRA